MALLSPICLKRGRRESLLCRPSRVKSGSKLFTSSSNWYGLVSVIFLYKKYQAKMLKLLTIYFRTKWTSVCKYIQTVNGGDNVWTLTISCVSTTIFLPQQLTTNSNLRGYARKFITRVHLLLMASISGHQKLQSRAWMTFWCQTLAS